MRALAFALVAVPLAACGFGFADDSSGGKEDLPTTGAGPYHRPESDLDTPADEPWVYTDRILDITEPELLPRDGGGFRFWVTREPGADPVGDTEIWAGAVRSPTELPDEGPAVVMTADLPWEEGHVAAPAIVVRPDRLIMFYEGGLTSRAIGRAESTDGGHTWIKAAAPLLADARSPGVATDGRTWIMAFTRPSTPGIFLARSDDGLSFTADAEPILVARPELPTSFDATLVAAPCLRWLEESSGRGHWALWFAGLKALPEGDNAPRYAIGYAASFDGMEWQRLAGGRPVITAPAGAPAVLVEGTHGTMLFDAVNGRRPSVGVATHP